jgi:hypothetical protein
MDIFLLPTGPVDKYVENLLENLANARPVGLLLVFPSWA